MEAGTGRAKAKRNQKELKELALNIAKSARRQDMHFA
jgi:hypothetical protein